MKLASTRKSVAAEPADERSVGGQVIGAQVKSARRALNLTLDALAETTGLNKSYLSRIERGEKSPSVATVMKIAQALSTPVATLFGETIADAAIHLVRVKSRRMLKNRSEKGAYPFAALSKSGARNRVESFVISPPAEFGADGHVHHDGEEVFFVLRGKVEVSFSDRSLALAEGDYLQFPGHLKHRVRRLTPAAEVLVVIALD